MLRFDRVRRERQPLTAVRLLAGVKATIVKAHSRPVLLPTHVRPALIIAAAPCLDQPLRLGQRVDPMQGQAFVPKQSIELPLIIRRSEAGCAEP